MSQPAENTPTNAPAPFDDANADIILRSCDGVQFRMYMLFLSLASPIFKDMLAIPQPPTPSGSASRDLPVVDLAESSTTIQNFLSLSYPTLCPPGVPDTWPLSEVADLIQAVMKYEIRGIQKAALQLLVQPRFLNTEPLRVYAIACRFRVEKEARLAAKHLLRHELLRDTYSADLEMIDAGSLYRVQLYHHMCTKAASRVASNTRWIKDGQYGFLGCGGDTDDFIDITPRDGTRAKCPRSCHVWLVEFLENAKGMLSRAVDLDAITDPDALAAAIACVRCRPRIARDLPAFIKAFQKEVKRTTSQVRTTESLIEIALTKSLDRSKWISGSRRVSCSAPRQPGV
jgi:hypothetical protein